MSAAASEPAHDADGPAIRTARKEGREVVTMRSFNEGSGWIVECDVYPVTGLRVEPLRPGPYRFADRDAADLFVREATLALSQLGCDVS